jgi:hypothetical protein
LTCSWRMAEALMRGIGIFTMSCISGKDPPTYVSHICVFWLHVQH